MDHQQLLQRRYAKILFVSQLAEHVFRAVVKPGRHIVAAQLLYRQQTLFEGQGGAFHQGLMDADGAVDFATRTEQVTQRQVGFNGVAVLFNMSRNRSTALSCWLESRKFTCHVFTRQAVGFLLFILLSASAPHVPTVRGSHGQQQKQQF